MCLILVAFRSHPLYRLILAANRDEYFDRPSAHAGFWENAPGLLAGRDLRAGGAWLGMTTGGKIAALTNFRDPAANMSQAPSRGRVVSRYLLGGESAVDYIESLSQEAHEYNGFNLIAGEKDRMYWYSNRSEGIRELAPGIYGLSNSLLDTPWPKTVKGKKALAQVLSRQESPLPEALFQILLDRSVADDKDLPDTGVGLEWERILSPIFIQSPAYGTRSSTVIFIDMDNRAMFIEKTFDPDTGKARAARYDFQIE